MALVQKLVHPHLEGRQSLAALHPHPHPVLPLYHYPTSWNGDTAQGKKPPMVQVLRFVGVLFTHLITAINIRFLDYHRSIRFRTRIVKKTFIEWMGQIKLYTRRFGCLGKVIDIL